LSINLNIGRNIFQPILIVCWVFLTSLIFNQILHSVTSNILRQIRL